MSEGRNPSALSTPNRTPAPSRPYATMGHVFTPRNRSESHSPHVINESHSISSERHEIEIYGTSINHTEITNKLTKFIKEFQVAPEDDRMGGIPIKKYFEDFKNLATVEQLHMLDIDLMHVKQFDIELYFQFIYYPGQLLTCADSVIREMYDTMFIQNIQDKNEKDKALAKKEGLLVSLKNIGIISKLRDLKSKDINRLISFRGIAIRCSEIMPEMKSALFKCINCESEVKVFLENARVEEPKECVECRRKQTMEVQHNMCQFENRQIIKFQELPEYVPEGDAPRSMNIIAYGYEVDSMKPGDRLEIVGMYRALPMRVSRGKRKIKSVFNTHIDLISAKVLKENRFSNDLDSQKHVFDDDEKKEFFNMSRSNNIIDKLVQSFAPSIFANDEVKKGILCQLFSGCIKNFSQAGRGRFRSDINICLVGDPSTAKSQMLQQVHKIAPRGVYTSGKGSSAVGLTANVRKDPETREYILESGALVLSDRGICCIDQFDKMDENHRTILLEAMEQQTISVAKAGIVCSLNSRTSILAAANPVDSRYDANKSVIENIHLPSALLSRFDLIYIMLDKATQQYDTKLAQHILQLYGKRQVESNVIKTPFSQKQLTNYITFARQEIFPQLTEESCSKLLQAYVTMRNLNNDKKTITATPRQLESLIRLSEAFAKMRLSTTVSVQDADNAIDLMKSAIQQSATDPKTGLIDMDVIVTGKTHSMRNRINKICAAIKADLDSNIAKYRAGMDFHVVMSNISTSMSSPQNPEQEKTAGEKISDEQLREALHVLKTEGVVALYGKNMAKPKVKLGKDQYPDK